MLVHVEMKYIQVNLAAILGHIHLIFHVYAGMKQGEGTNVLASREYSVLTIAERDGEARL